MKPARFEYVRPQSRDEAVALLARYGEDAAVLAGGQSLMPMLNLRVARPAVLVDIKRIAGLDGIAVIGDRLMCGTLVRHAEAMGSAAIRDGVPLLGQALHHVAHPAIRNRGTMGGSLALADPAAELPACAVCLGAEITLASQAGERRVAAGDFFRGVYSTAMMPGEMILRIDWPVLGPSWRVAFDEVSRRHGDFALAGLAVAIRIEDGLVRECRMATCGIEAAPRRLARVEACLVARSLDRLVEADAAAADAMESEVDPLHSDEAPAEWRRSLGAALVKRLCRRLQAEAVERA